MSHVTVSNDFVCSDLDCLKEVCKDLKLEFRENQKTYRWYNMWMDDFHAPNAAYKTVDPSTFGHCEHAISLPNNKKAYELGLITGEKGYNLIYDTYRGGYGLEEVIGKDASILKDCYLEKRSIKLGLNSLWSLSNQYTEEDGTRVLEFT